MLAWTLTPKEKLENSPNLKVVQARNAWNHRTPLYILSPTARKCPFGTFMRFPVISPAQHRRQDL
jgi:hypothetical protein